MFTTSTKISNGLYLPLVFSFGMSITSFAAAEDANKPDDIEEVAPRIVSDNAAEAGTFNLLIENDVFTGTDKHYTNGLQLSYLSGALDPDSIRFKLANVLPGVSTEGELRMGWHLGQSIFTPQDTQATTVIPNERPYAGWLYAGFSIVYNTDDHIDTLSMTAGTIGPDAKGEQAQNGFHDLINSEESLGWDNQLDNQLGGYIIAERKWRALAQTKIMRLGVDIMPHIGVSLGNIEMYANTGFTVRMGNDLDNDFGPPRIRPALPGSGYFVPHDYLAWYLFAGVDGRYIERNIFLEGDRNGVPVDLDVKEWVGDVQAGLVITFSSFRLAYTYVARTREYAEQVEPDKFGSLGLTMRF